MMNKKKNDSPVIILLIGIWLLSSCTYRFSGEDKAPFGINRICVQMLENKTGETGIEAFFSDALIYELTRDGRMTAAPRKTADAVVTGVVKNMDTETIAHERSYVALERRVKIGVDLTLRDLDGNLLWSGDNIFESESYLVSTDKLVTEQNRREAIREISRRVAQKVYQRLSWGR